MKILRTKPDPSPDASGPPTYVTGDTHWWDGSQVYGGKLDFADGLRSHEKGRLRIDDKGLPPEDLQKFADLSGVAGNFWVGLAILHSLFMREHNAICERLRAEYPEMSDQELYDKARLVNAALMAKIHTVDWTPAIIAHPTTVLALAPTGTACSASISTTWSGTSPTTRCCTASRARRRTTTECRTR